MADPPLSLTPELIELIARRFRVLGEPMRIRLLDHLRAGPATVTELREATNASQQNVSKHLGVLMNEHMVSRTKVGNTSRYEIADPVIFDLCEQVCGGLRRSLDELSSILEGSTS